MMAWACPRRPAARGRTMWLLGLLALALAVPPKLAAQVGADPNDPDGTIGPPPELKGVREGILRAMSENPLPSVAIGVARGDRILWQEGIGWADLEARRRATAHTMYSLASISKPITATGLMVLVDEGRVDLDSPVNRYLGAGKVTSAAGESEEATVRRVLSHTAGLPLHYQFFYEDGGYDPPTMDETIGRYGRIVYPPADVYQYSNLGYGILDHVIARVSGRSYADFMRGRVFVPLGMTRTSIHVSPGQEPYVAARYDPDGRRIPFYDFDHRGASAVYSSAHDLLRFGMFHLGHVLADQRSVVSDTLRRVMRAIHTPGDDTSGYGLGWGVADDRGLRRVGHSGGMPGVRTFLALYPDEDLVVTVLANTSSNLVFRFTEDVVAALVPSYAEALARDRAEDEADPANSATSGGGDSAVPAALAGRWEGTLETWDRSHPMTMTIDADGDVHVRVGDGLVTVLNPLGGSPLWNEDETRLIGRFLGTIPTPDASRHPHSILLDLRLRNGSLLGQASAQTTDPPIYFALSSYVRLHRAGDGS